jgi:hypothetical protein
LKVGLRPLLLLPLLLLRAKPLAVYAISSVEITIGGGGHSSSRIGSSSGGNGSGRSHTGSSAA